MLGYPEVVVIIRVLQFATMEFNRKEVYLISVQILTVCPFYVGQPVAFSDPN